MPASIQELDVPLNRDVFMRNLIRELAGSMESMIGLEEASGFISIVGRRIGQEIDRDFREAFGVEKLDLEQVAAVLVELKRRIDGGFRVVSVDDSKIVFANTDCPFGDKVVDRPSMCMMTSNVFGTITADNLGYARVDIEKSIAAGDGECRVVVHLQPGAEAQGVAGRAYFGVS